MLIDYKLMREYDNEQLWDNIVGTASLKGLMKQLWGDIVVADQTEQAIIDQLKIKVNKYYKKSTDGNVRNLLIDMQKLASHNGANVGFVDVFGNAYMVSKHQIENRWKIYHPEDDSYLFELAYGNKNAYIENPYLNYFEFITQDNFASVLPGVLFKEKQSHTIYLYSEAMVRGFLAINKMWRSK